MFYFSEASQILHCCINDIYCISKIFGEDLILALLASDENVKIEYLANNSFHIGRNNYLS